MRDIIGVGRASYKKNGVIAIKTVSCKTCMHRIDKKKKDQVEQRKDVLLLTGEEVIIEYPQSRYANQKCEVEGYELKFGIIDCPNYERG